MGCAKTEDKYSRLAEFTIAFNSWRMGRKKFSIKPENILILLPNCLQNSDCIQNVAKDISNCKLCGLCKIKDMVEISSEFGTKVFVATGGRIALKKVLEDDVNGIVAVACEKELREGIKASPKPVLTITNTRPNGPCYETTVEPDHVRRAILQMINSE